jgi:streptogramin lyase
MPQHTVDSTFAIQTNPQQYVTLLPKLPVSSPSPFLIYPTDPTIWVAGVSADPNPIGSQIRQFFINGTSRVVLNLTNVIVSSIVADPANPSSKLWFTKNSTLSFYDSTQAKETKAISFPGQSLQYLTHDSQGRIWISMAGSSGDSNIAVYDPLTHANQTYGPVPTKGAIIQGITVTPGNTIWFAEAGSKKLGRLVPGIPQGFSEFSPPAAINLAAPVQVAVDASGNVWFTDHASNQFGVFDPQAATWKVFPIGYCLNNCISGLPNAIFVDANTIWFSEHIAGRIGRYDPSTGVLTEYSVPGSSPPGLWWAMPGPKNLVWFVAVALGQIGYVNSSIPVSIGLSGVASEVAVQRGSYQRVPIVVNSVGQKFSLNSSEVTQDAPPFNPPQIYSTSQSDIAPAGNPYATSITISAAWNATLGRRYVALTAFNSQVSLSLFTRVTVVESSIPYVTFGFVLMTILGGLIIYVKRPRKASAKFVRRARK